MPKLTCELCGLKTEFNQDEDLYTCSKCKLEQPTGLEKSIRSRIENYRTIPIPVMTVGRAIGFAAGIYELSTHDQKISGIENRLRAKTGMDGGLTEAVEMVAGNRSNTFQGVTLTDKRVGLLIYRLSGKMQGREWNTTYIVFRGSRGAEIGSKDNPEGAGWDDTGGVKHNLDWGTNFNNAQVTAPWCSSVKVHNGFLDMYRSMRSTILQAVKNVQSLGLQNTQYVCTGHSLGAALSTICAHDLACSTEINPVCYSFCSPKAGNLAFARNFSLRISSKLAQMACEPSQQPYSRGITFVQGNDPVSWGSKHGLMAQKKAFTQAFATNSPVKPGGPTHGKLFGNSGYQHLRSEGQRLADTGSTVRQILWTLPQRNSSVNIYYLVPNVYRVSRLGLHSYLKMEEELLGKR